MVAHYTTLDAAFNILQEKGVVFRASRQDHMNDPNDCLFGRDCLDKCIEDGLIGETHSRGEDKELLWHYIVSFSPQIDSPIMWRLYHADIALVFDKTVIQQHCKDENGIFRYFYGNCKYADDTTFIDVYKEVFSELPFTSYHDDENAEYAIALIKHKDYEIEPEFRLIMHREQIATASYEEGVKDVDADEDCLYRASRGKVCFYKECIIPKEALRKIIIHDNENYDHYLRKWLKKNHYDTTKIEIIETSTAKVIY